MKIAVITGASSGIGEEFTTCLDKDEQFDEIWVIARRKQRLESIQARAKVRVLPMDLTDESSFEEYEKLLREVKPTVIRGNISEIRTLAAGSGTTQGVDADAADKVTDETLDKTVAFAKAFAARTGAVVAVTGAIDIVADGERAFCIRNGHPMMSAVTGTGCQLSALTAAFCAANPDKPLEAAAAAVCAMGLAGETAHSRLSRLDGNATYRNYIIDAIFNMTPEQLEEGARYEMR